MSHSGTTLTTILEGDISVYAKYPNSKKESMTRTAIYIDKNGHAILILYI